MQVKTLMQKVKSFLLAHLFFYYEFRHHVE